MKRIPFLLYLLLALTFGQTTISCSENLAPAQECATALCESLKTVVVGSDLPFFVVKCDSVLRVYPDFKKIDRTFMLTDYTDLKVSKMKDNVYKGDFWAVGIKREEIRRGRREIDLLSRDSISVTIYMRQDIEGNLKVFDSENLYLPREDYVELAKRIGCPINDKMTDQQKAESFGRVNAFLKKTVNDMSSELVHYFMDDKSSWKVSYKNGVFNCDGIYTNPSNVANPEFDIKFTMLDSNDKEVAHKRLEIKKPLLTTDDLLWYNDPKKIRYRHIPSRGTVPFSIEMKNLPDGIKTVKYNCLLDIDILVDWLLTFYHFTGEEYLSVSPVSFLDILSSKNSPINSSDI